MQSARASGTPASHCSLAYPGGPLPHSTTQLSCDVPDRSFAAAKAPTNANDPAAPLSKGIDLPAMQPLTKLRGGNGIAWGEHV